MINFIKAYYYLERDFMSILDLDEAKERSKRSVGAVYIRNKPQIRSGKKNDYMVGRFTNKDQEVDFKIWEEHIYRPVVEHGTGIYQAEVVGSEYNNQVYLTVTRIEVQKDESINKEDFLSSVPMEKIQTLWKDARQNLSRLGVQDKTWMLIDKMTDNKIIKDRFWVEGAATNHHDNLIGGLANHSIKMLRILATLVENDKRLVKHIDLLTVGTLLHDVGKVFEYDNLEMGKYWYANHRARGLEYIAEFRDEIISTFDERFYRQLQSIIIGHHGDYGDRPTTVAAAIVHYIDTLESQVTDLLQMEARSNDGRIFVRDWGYLAGLDY